MFYLEALIRDSVTVPDRETATSQSTRAERALQPMA